jgi:hypothetical protein
MNLNGSRFARLSSRANYPLFFLFRSSRSRVLSSHARSILFFFSFAPKKRICGVFAGKQREYSRYILNLCLCQGETDLKSIR